MFARISSYKGSPGKVREGSRVIEEITPEMQGMPGFQRAYLFVNDKSGKALTVSLWGTEEEANQSTAPAAKIRDRISQALGASGKPNVEICEVATDLRHRTEGGRFARLSEYKGSPDKIANGIRAARDAESPLKRMQGFDELFLFVDRKSGRSLTISLWDSESALNRSSTDVTPLRENISRGLGAGDNPTSEVFEVAGDIPQRARKAA